MKRYHLIVKGRVQGVGFRWFCMNHAKSLGVTGTVENLDNGDVEIYMQGDKEALNEFFARIIKGDRYIDVRDYEIEEVPVEEEERVFDYRW